MVDVDGVLIAHPDARGWSANLEQDLGVPLMALQQTFFDRHWDDVVHGRASLRDRLAPALSEIAPSVTCDILIDYWFKNDAHVDRRLLAELQAMRSEGVEVHLATVQEHERASYLWDRLGLGDQLDGMHYAAALGCSKPDPAFYRSVEAATGLEPAAIFFIDDKPANVTGARNCNWTAALWTGEQTLQELLTQQSWTMG